MTLNLPGKIYVTLYGIIKCLVESVILYPHLTLSLPVTRICVNYSTVYNDTLVAKGLILIYSFIHNMYLFTIQL